MKKSVFYRTSLIAAIATLCVILVAQVYWFYGAYNTSEKQFDERVILALRDVNHQYLVLENDRGSSIAPIKQIASNSYQSFFRRTVKYDRLDSLLRKVFVTHNLLVPFELSVYEEYNGQIAFGNFYKNGPSSSAQATCLGRAVRSHIPMNVVITFPNKKTDIVAGMSIWIFSGSIFCMIVALMAFVMLDLSKQRRIAGMKADFVNNITHELQTPISNISIATEVLAKSGNKLTDEKFQHYTGIISAENQRLRMHVEQVLQTALVDHGELTLNRREVDINSLLKEVVDTFRIRIKNRAGKIMADFNALQPIVLGDPYHIKNIFFSLLDNAEKYSRDEPHITVATSNRENGVVVTITDNGIGIGKEYQPYIFDKFFRVPNGDIHDTKGFGLGLSYVNSMVVAHNGKVSVTSQRDKGSSFEVYFVNPR